MLHFSKCTLLGGLFEGPAHTEPSILSTYIRSITLFHLYSYDIISRLRKAALRVLFSSNSWQLCIKQQYVIEFWLECFRLTLKRFSLVPYCMGKEYPRVDGEAFCNVFWWSGEEGGDEGWRMAFRDATPETWCTQSHCLIRLSIQLTLLYRQGQGSNQFNMVAGGGTATQWVQPTYNYIQHWSRHMGYSTVVDFPTLQCYCSVLCYTSEILSHNPSHCPCETFGECITSSAQFGVKPWHAKSKICANKGSAQWKKKCI